MVWKTFKWGQTSCYQTKCNLCTKSFPDLSKAGLLICWIILVMDGSLGCCRFEWPKYLQQHKYKNPSLASWSSFSHQLDDERIVENPLFKISTMYILLWVPLGCNQKYSMCNTAETEWPQNIQLLTETCL